MEWNNLLRADAVLVPGQFIDEYMKQANGEYVKVYLYLLRHAPEQIGREQIADALDMTRADVNRALSYWKKAGVLDYESAKPAAAGRTARKPAEDTVPQGAVTAVQKSSPAAAENPAPEKPAGQPVSRAVDTAALERDEEFKQLVYISQQYLNKLFTQRDTEVLGNLYQNLGMSAELLEYLMEYCAENRHTSLRYAETVALNWKSEGITTAKEARERSANRNRRVFSVMKAMGLNDRNPGKSELEHIRRWFEEYGFDEKIVTEACSRTLERTHKPSFPYAEGILRDWKEAGVKTFADIAAQDSERSAEKARGDAPENRAAAGRRRGQKATRFDNFEGHGYDYDEMVWNMISRDAGGNDGTE